MLGYVTLGTNDLERAREFYDALLAEVGASRKMQFPETGFTLYGTGDRSPGIAITRPYDGNPATVGNGNMAAIAVRSRAMVDRLHARAIALGGSCEGPPGLRTEECSSAFYGAYFRDLDGNKLCAFKIGGPDTPEA